MYGKIGAARDIVTPAIYAARLASSSRKKCSVYSIHNSPIVVFKRYDAYSRFHSQVYINVTV